MKIEIFDVGHGSAALAIADNQNLVLFDCGHDDRGFRPSQYLPQRWKAVQWLFVSHYDSDHVSDLAALCAKMPIERIVSNPTISVDEIRRLKLQEGPLRPGMVALLNMKSSFGPVKAETKPALSGINVKYFWNTYKRFQDMNNLSVVAFLEYDDFSIVFPGDIERAGWQELLKGAAFQECLKRVKVFVASHHGRQNGYCEEVFKFCGPDIVVISDKSIQHDTQEHCYDNHSNGMSFSRDGWRYVLTTRRDGHITINKPMGQAFTISIR